MKSTFQFISKQYFTTSSDSLTSRDSVVFTLASFEMDPILQLGLPVYIIIGSDSVPTYSEQDSIYLILTVKETTGPPELKSNTNPMKVWLQFNYIYFAIGLGILIILIVSVALIFGKNIQKETRIYFIKKRHKKFTVKYVALIRNIDNVSDKHYIENTLLVWKTYLEKLEKVPFTKMTTKEILKVHNNEQLINTLKAIDGNIYGGKKVGELFPLYDILLNYSSFVCDKKIENIKNAS